MVKNLEKIWIRTDLQRIYADIRENPFTIRENLYL